MAIVYVQPPAGNSSVGTIPIKVFFSPSPGDYIYEATVAGPVDTYEVEPLVVTTSGASSFSFYAIVDGVYNIASRLYENGSLVATNSYDLTVQPYVEPPFPPSETPTNYVTNVGGNTPSTYELRVVDQSGGVVMNLPNADLTRFEQNVNQPDVVEFSVPFDDPLWWDLPSMFQTGGWPYEIQLYINGVLRFWGPALTISGDAVITCEDSLAYFKARYISHASVLYTSIDQAAILANLVSYAQTPPPASGVTAEGASYGITTSAVNTGVNRSREWKRSEKENILSAMQSMGATELKNGLDFRVVPYVDGRKVFTTYYPFRGHAQSYDTNGKVKVALEEGRNIVDVELELTSVGRANQVYVTGGSSGDVYFEGVYANASVINTTHRMMTVIVNEGTQSDVEYLAAKAEQITKSLTGEIATVKFTLINTESTNYLDQLECGQLVDLRVDSYRRLTGTFRITKMIWDPNTPDILEVEVTNQIVTA